MTFTGRIVEVFALKNRGTVLLVQDLRGVPKAGDALASETLTGTVLALPDGKAVRTHACLTGQPLQHGPECWMLTDVPLVAAREAVGELIHGEANRASLSDV